jgi:hypothetical protein
MRGQAHPHGRYLEVWPVTQPLGKSWPSLLEPSDEIMEHGRSALWPGAQAPEVCKVKQRSESLNSSIILEEDGGPRQTFFHFAFATVAGFTTVQSPEVYGSFPKDVTLTWAIAKLARLES